MRLTGFPLAFSTFNPMTILSYENAILIVAFRESTGLESYLLKSKITSVFTLTQQVFETPKCYIGLKTFQSHLFTLRCLIITLVSTLSTVVFQVKNDLKIKNITFDANVLSQTEPICTLILWHIQKKFSGNKIFVYSQIFAHCQNYSSLIHDIFYHKTVQDRNNCTAIWFRALIEFS